MKRSIYALAAFLFANSLAHAHSQLTASTPADHESLATAPKELVLHFSEPVRLTSVSVAASGGASRKLDAVPTGRQKDFVIAAPDLGPGDYSVSWRALSDDAHVMTGAFTFSVGPHGSTGHGAHAQH